MLTKERLRALRNDLPIEAVLRGLGAQAPPSKRDGERLRFQCPYCAETLAVVNPRNNLAHCFNCARNFNNIDLLLALGYDFKTAAARLQEWLDRHRQTGSGPPVALRQAPSRPDPKNVERLAEIFRRQFGNGPA
ncbi:MAG: hypothetical protein AMXMBFR7_50880 [Planctomycetota bacterium]